MVDELTTREVGILTSMCVSLLSREGCVKRDYKSDVIESLTEKGLIRWVRTQIFLTPKAVEFLSGIVNRELTELTPEGKAQMMEDIMDGYYG